MGKNDLLGNRLKTLQEQNKALKQERPDVVQNIASGAAAEEEKPDFMKMAEALEAQKEERKSELDGFTKDTIYIRSDLYNALQALCTRQGDKKRLVNQMYEEFLTKKYKELQSKLEVDK